MANKAMKTLTIGDNTYEIVDETARADIETLKSTSCTVTSVGGKTGDVTDPTFNTVTANKIIGAVYA